MTVTIRRKSSAAVQATEHDRRMQVSMPARTQCGGTDATAFVLEMGSHDSLTRSKLPYMAASDSTPPAPRSAGDRVSAIILSQAATESETPIRSHASPRTTGTQTNHCRGAIVVSPIGHMSLTATVLPIPSSYQREDCVAGATTHLMLNTGQNGRGRAATRAQHPGWSRARSVRGAG